VRFTVLPILVSGAAFLITARIEELRLTCCQVDLEGRPEATTVNRHPGDVLDLLQQVTAAPNQGGNFADGSPHQWRAEVHRDRGGWRL